VLRSALRVLARRFLGHAIQTSEHEPAEDARAALLIYLMHRKVCARGVRAGASHACAGVGRIGAHARATQIS
jgi:hypothetical protein